MLLPEHTIDFARKAIRSCIADLKVASGRLERGQSRQAKGAIEAACNKMRPHFITLPRDMQEARENYKFLDWLSSSPVRNAEAIISLAERLISFADGAQYAEQSNAQEAHSQSSGGGLTQQGFEVGPSDAPAVANQRDVPVTSDSACSNREATESNVQSTPTRKRGRPKKIPDELKLKALNAKGGKARAQILYQTTHPTVQQVKNVPSIINNFKRTHQSSGS